jgi:phospholipase C
VSDRFRALSALSYDVQHEPPCSWPQVILIEPDYEDSPIHLSGHASDNHPPVPVAFGEMFLRQIYEALTSNPERWKRTVLIVTYDEHGGFYDHVAPPPIACAPPPGANYTAPFATAGVRVPAIVASPMVARGKASHVQLDHTSILLLLADRFAGAGEPYSAAVDARRGAGMSSVSAVLDASVARADIPILPRAPLVTSASLTSARAAATPSQKAFVAALDGFASDQGQPALAKYPEIAHWRALR